jgi:hypothetical protein
MWIQTDQGGKIEMKAMLRSICVITVVLITLSSLIHPASGMIQASIIPPSPYAVYTGQTYSLTVGVQYNVPKEADKNYGPYRFWIESPPSQSGTQELHGSGTTAFQLVLRAPSSPGVYTLGLKLLVQAAKQASTIMDTATVTYEVIEPVKTDWDVEKVWIEPKSPGAGDQVTFQATIVLRSTTST